MSTTIKIRIAVAVDERGNWNSCGWKAGSDKDKMDNALEVLPVGAINCFWVEAEIALPGTIQGKAVPTDTPFEFPETHP
jgi:hypothetical protein